MFASIKVCIGLPVFLLQQHKNKYHVVSNAFLHHLLPKRKSYFQYYYHHRNKSTTTLRSFQSEILSTEIETDSTNTTTTSSSSTQISSKSTTISDTFINPLGPPNSLHKLHIHDEYTIHNHPFFSNDKDKDKDNNKIIIRRLSKEPDIFLLENFLHSDTIRSILIQGALEKGLKIAGTKNSNDGSIRKNSYLTWIEKVDSKSYSDDNYDDNHDEVGYIANCMTQFVAETFIHETLLNQRHPNSNISSSASIHNDYITLEDLQIAKYDKGGCFHEHHDGFGRFLTVLTYLNGVGGTFFPYAKTTDDDDDDIGDINTGLQLLQTRSGLLVVGTEGLESYYSNNIDDNDNTRNKVDPANIVPIKAGDAIVFYNYNIGDRDLRSVHESLTVPCEKWIATNWVRSESLTGSFSHLHLERLLENMS